MRDAVQSLAEEVDAACALCTVAKDSVLLLTAANLRGSDSVVGVTFPFAAPMSPGFVGDDVLDAMLQRVRERGYAVSVGQAMADRFERVVGAPGKSRPTSRT